MRIPTFFRVLVVGFVPFVAVTNGAACAQIPLLNEFMASNSRTLADQDGAFPDWIEIHNPDVAPINMEGWYLTDSRENRTRWQFSAVTIPAGGYLVVFASGKNRREPNAQLHTNFSLDADGEYLALIKPDGVTPVAEFDYPAQSRDVSYGFPATTSATAVSATFLERPTPGQTNARAQAPVLAQAATFSRPAGVFHDKFSLEISGAVSNQRIRYTVTPAATGAQAPAPTATSPAYSKPIEIEASVVVRAAVFSEVDGTSGPVTTAHYSKLHSSLTSFSSRLPVLVLDDFGAGPLSKDGIDHRSSSHLFAARASAGPTFVPAPEASGPLTVTVRGASSAEFPKKSYTLKFNDADGNKRAQALLDLPAYERWTLVGPWKFDQSYVNNAFVYALSNRIGRWAPRTRFVEVFFNGQADGLDQADYAGIYALTDRIEIGKGRVELKDLSPSETSGEASTGGYILKIDTKDADEIGWRTSRGIPEGGTASIILAHPSAEDIVPAQLDYIRDYVQRMENALVSDRDGGWAQRSYLEYIDRESWVDHHLLNTFVCNPDAFVKSAYFTKDRGAKLAAGPVWDFDRALGSYWDERSYRWEVWSGVGGVDTWRTGWWGILAQDPEFMQDWVDRWQSLRRAALSDASLGELVETLGSQVGADAAARDAARWPDNASPYGSYANQIARLRNWVTLRARWIDERFLAAPSVAVVGNVLTFSAPAGARLAYTTDGSDPRALGGELAATAKLADAPLTVSASTNIHVRSYRADWRDAFPGSPWSSVAGGTASTPLQPRARLVNLSSRAIVGSGEDALVAGVVVADTAGKRYLARAVGPGLAAFGVPDVLSDPQLVVFEGSKELVRNSSWESGPDAARLPTYSQSVGAFPLAAGVRDAALVGELKTGAYTLQVLTPGDRPGLALAELYELDAKGRSVNLSARARVRVGSGALIGGFVIQGAGHKRMLLRAVGPTLAAFGITQALRDPVLSVYSGPNVVATNDRWEVSENVSAIIAASRAVGAFSLTTGSEDAALIVTLPPGAYTVEVKGKADTEGVALLEIYDLP